MICVIIGHRGSGKTSFLKLLSRNYEILNEHYKKQNQKFHFFDLDQEISKETSMSIKGLFEKEGEKKFRLLEKKKFLEIYQKFFSLNPSNSLDSLQKSGFNLSASESFHPIQNINLAHKKKMGLAYKEKNFFFISVGAGFRLLKLNNIKVLWIQRRTDLDGRIFLDRPRLDLKEESPLREYFKFYLKRNQYFEKRAHYKFLIPEGLKKGLKKNSFFKSHFIQYVLNELDQLNSFNEFNEFRESRRRVRKIKKERSKENEELKLGGVLTLQKALFSSKEEFKKWVQRRIYLRVSFFEIRDDLLSFRQIFLAFQVIPKEKIIFSFRKDIRDHAFHQRKRIFSFLIKNQILWDWPIEKKKPPFKNPSILSFHDREKKESLKSCVSKLNQFLKKYTHYFEPSLFSKEEDERGDKGEKKEGGKGGVKKEDTGGNKTNSKKKNLSQGVKRKGHFNQTPYLKLSVLVSSFKELWEGHLWWLEDPERRSFLPRSPNGLWSWYRILHKEKMKINFFREFLPTPSFVYADLFGQNGKNLKGSLLKSSKEDFGAVIKKAFLDENPDQPFIMEWMNTPGNWKNFLAVLGNPIHHSLTPFEQNGFSKKYFIPVVKIPLSKKRCTRKALEVLRGLKLIGAAVTSPLKQKMYLHCEEKSALASKLKSVNTLFFKKGRKNQSILKGYNTDFFALQCLSKKLKFKNQKGDQKRYKKVAVWGGGGVLSAVQKAFPSALFFSSRSGKLKTLENVSINRRLFRFSPDLLIWAAGRRKGENILFPEKKWKPKLVLDLNYTDQSPGKEYAQKFNLPYQSGLEMFKLQAKVQRKIWEREILNLKKSMR